MHDRARKEIIDYLVANGPLRDGAGRTTLKLRQGVSYEGTYAGFTQLIASMERSGQLIREVRGKRTYSIAAVQKGGSASANFQPSPIVRTSSTDGDNYDYDELAASLLVRVVGALSGKGLGKASPSWAQRRLRSFERRNSQLEHELTVANAAIRKISDERDQLKRRLEQAEGNISILQDGIAVSKPRESRATALLNPEDRALLTQLRNAPDISLDDGVDIASAAE